MNKEQSPEELLGGVAEHDEVAFSELYDRLAGRLYGLASRMVSPSDAEMVLQEVFFRLWHEAGTIRQAGGSVVAWLTLSVRSVAVDRLRALARTAADGGLNEHQPGPEKAAKPVRRLANTPTGRARVKSSAAVKPTVAAVTTLFPAAWLPLPREIALIDDRLALIHKAIHQLPKPQRQALDLAVYGGRSEMEIAVEMAEPLGKAQRSLRAAVTFVRHRQRAVCGTWAANI